MNKSYYFLFILVIFSVNTIFSQLTTKPGGQTGNNDYRNTKRDSINNPGEINVTLSGKTKHTDYKIFSHKRDTSYIDTTLSIKKDYKFNYLRTDNFELLGFHNQGQTFNNLGYSFNNIKQLPDIGFTSKQFSYIDIEDVKYYEVPTPTTEILYRTGLQQGQVLDALFTLNFSKRLNVSLSYKGLRSLGAYRKSIASNGNFRGTFHYRTKENQYEVRGHVTSQDFFNEESGGLTTDALASFISEDPDFENRARLDVNLTDAENQFDATRVYLEHSFKLLSSKDTVNHKDFSNLKVGHIFTNETKSYSYTQATATTAIFGNTSTTDATDTDAKSKITSNELNLEFNSKYVLGKFKAKANFTNYSYGYDTILNSNSSIKKLKLEGSAISFGADWKAKIKNFYLNADASITPGSGRLAGNYLKGEAVYKQDSLFTFKGSLLISSKTSNFNTLLHQSFYDDYNWENNFSNVNTRDLGFTFNSKWINADLNFTNIDNYTYFDENNSILARGLMVDGIRHGKWIFYDANNATGSYHPNGLKLNKIMSEGFYQDGIRMGTWDYDYFLDVNTHVKGSLSFENGVNTGRLDFYKIEQHPSFGLSETLVGSGAYANGKKIGRWIEFNHGTKGDFIETGNYDKNGKRNGPWKVRIAHQTYLAGSYNNGVPHGKFNHYYDNGQLKYESSFNNGLEEGEFKRYYKNGQLQEQGTHVIISDETTRDTSLFTLKLAYEQHFLLIEEDFSNMHYEYVTWLQEPGYSIKPSELNRRFNLYRTYGFEAHPRVANITVKNKKTVREGDYLAFYEDGGLKLKGSHSPHTASLFNPNEHTVTQTYARTGEWKEYGTDQLLKNTYIYEEGKLKKIKR